MLSLLPLLLLLVLNKHTLQLALLLLLTIVLPGLVRFKFGLDILVKFFKLLVDFAWVEHATLGVRPLCVLPDLFD